MHRRYDVVALQMTIWFNREGDHDHNGLIYALKANEDLLKYIELVAAGASPDADLTERAAARAEELCIDLPATVVEARIHPLVRPLVLRANHKDKVTICLTNRIKKRPVGIHLVGRGYDVRAEDGSEVGANPPSLVPPGATRSFTWECPDEGVFPFHDGGDYSGGEDGTNVHGLFGAFIVEPRGAIWRDPVTGLDSTKDPQLDGLYLDVIPPDARRANRKPGPDTIEGYEFEKPREYHDFHKEAHREFVIFFHDEPEFVPPHLERHCPDPCEEEGGGHSGGHGGGDDFLPIMPISYRAEPMVNREHRLFCLIEDGHDFKDRPVLNEEQHHSSWMFGDPATPILKAYIGDPVRIRFVHAAVKETHVFHLHLYEWHAVPEDLDSPRIDAISVSPQTAHTIEPVWGAGNRHQVAGDVIWHCHLYPHFHEGMWGIFRTFETLQEGKEGPLLADQDGVYEGRRIGVYPDKKTIIEQLLPLPDRTPPPRPTPTHPGYPLYIPGEMEQKSPIPPWPPGHGPLPADHDYRAAPTPLESNAFNRKPVPGEMFTRHPFVEGQTDQWNYQPHNPLDPPPDRTPLYALNSARQRQDDLIVASARIEYNDYGWHDRDGHFYYRAEDGQPGPDERRPLFFRAQHGQILNLTLNNRTPRVIEETEFDHAFPPCDKRPWQGECSPHVHMVKFDPICADGASVGWNYMSGPVHGKKMSYRWWLDQEFGTIFFHDHLFANYRQKHGLFGALIVEPAGAKFRHPREDREIVSGTHARIEVPKREPGEFREFCIGIGDFIPMWDKDDNPLNPPDHPGGHGDQGVMALNYRSDPIRERLKAGDEMVDPSLWFTSLEPYNRDPQTELFETFEREPIWFRVVQGSHEEQHSFQIHGMRWRRFRGNAGSAIRNQQTFGIAEAFTFLQEEPYGPGDYMYKLSSSDDLWLGCWGIVRAFEQDADGGATGGLKPLDPSSLSPGRLPAPCAFEKFEDVLKPVPGVRKFFVVAKQRRLVYRDPDLIDPCGLVYCLEAIIDPDRGNVPVRQLRGEDPAEPLILRCREGETVRLYLQSDLPPLRPEPFAPEVPVEARNPFSHRPERLVSSRASVHADLLVYDVRESDGATVGRNPRQDAAPGDKGWRVYCWETHRPPPRPGDPEPNAGEPLGPLLLQDMADFRNHRHHGLIGALIVEPADARPLFVPPGRNTARLGRARNEAWDGPRATVVSGRGAKARTWEEAVLLLQDGLRFFLRGNIHMPISNEPPANGEDEADHEDQGQKGFNYRSEPVERFLNDNSPATPIFRVPANSLVRLHLIGAQDKPRNQSFTVHGVTWPEWRFLDESRRPMVASESAVTTGTARTFEFKVGAPADYGYRSGVLKWAVPQGLWGLLRVG